VRWLALIVFFWSLPFAAAGEVPREQWIVVAAPAFRDVTKPLCDHRRAQGMDVSVLDSGDQTAEAIRDKLRGMTGGREGASYVLLVGAASGDGVADPAACVVPSLRGESARMAGKPSDNGYGCPAGSAIPTVAVGRFPARTEAEARAMVEKTIAWESDVRPGLWHRRLTVLAGAPSYAPAVDALIERVSFAELGRLGPIWHGSAIYDNPNSPFTLPSRRVREQALAYMREGQLFTVYLGHSSAEGFSGIRCADWAALDVPRGAGVFATFGCYGCQMGARDGYGVYAVRNPRGPVAVIGATGESWPTMGLLLARGLLDVLADGNVPPRLAPVWIGMKKHLAVGYLNPVFFSIANAVDGSNEVPPELQRIEHLEMYVLLGDPALKLPKMPTTFPLTVEGEVGPGASVTVWGEVPAALNGAKGRLTIERALTAMARDLERLPADAPEDQRTRILEENHRRANRFVLVGCDIAVKDGRFGVRLALPDPLPYPSVIVRAYLATDVDEGMAARVVPNKEWKVGPEPGPAQH
jgi:hypothetical protein